MKCRFAKECGNYEKGGMCDDEFKVRNYYGPGRPSGCWRRALG